MKLLVIGGTSFVGRHFVEAAMAKGHALTLFNRGKTNPDLFPDAEHIKGDRDGDLSQLEGGKWDAVLDTSGYLPRVVRKSAAALAGIVDHYTFISSISVYQDPFAGGDESAPLGTLEDELTEEITGETYGPLKVLCENSVREEMSGRSLIIRPGLIVGPHDPTDRFTYWPVRVAEGGDVLAPGGGDSLVQFIDARDLASWMLKMIENSETGDYNATGPAEELSMKVFLESINEAMGGKANLEWVGGDFLQSQSVGPWMEVPLWLGSDEAHMKADIGKAVAAGLSFRPTEEIAKNTNEWARSRPEDHEWKAGLSREKEATVLQAWREARSA